MFKVKKNRGQNFEFKIFYITVKNTLTIFPNYTKDKVSLSNVAIKNYFYFQEALKQRVEKSTIKFFFR